MEISIEKKERIIGIDFSRACCAIGIIIFHYFCHSAGDFKFLYTTANCYWGGLFVTVFFAISGSVLYYNYPEIESLKTFYFKRWKSIFPAFYICYMGFYLLTSIYRHDFLYAGNPLKFLFSIFGMDGYFFYKLENYYQVGEWFLGAIIMLYILYPLLVVLMNKNLFIVPYLLLLGYLLMYFTNLFVIDTFNNLITCMASFYIGMIAMKYRLVLFKNKIIGSLAFITFVFLRFVELPNFVLFHQIQGFALLIVLVQSGNYIMETKLKVLFEELSKLSFCIFLFQHKVIVFTLRFFNPEEWYLITIMLLLVIGVTVFCAKILSLIIAFLLRTKCFMRIESKFLK